jgi:copper oxidase (laccase) domain-containing protein
LIEKSVTNIPCETFPALSEFSFCRHAFINRIPGVDVKTDREIALQRLNQFHAEAAQNLGFAPAVGAEQVHGNGVALVDEQTRGPVAGVDGLITNRTGISLGIYVADCCAVYLLDPVRRCIGLLHSGKKGTDLGIVPAAIEKMRAAFGCEPRDIIAQLSPCIRPPDYETDFAAEIVKQCHTCGVGRVHDCGANTAADLQRYYSYRAERGKTGRMLALLALTDVILGA